MQSRVNLSGEDALNTTDGELTQQLVQEREFSARFYRKPQREIDSWDNVEAGRCAAVRQAVEETARGAAFCGATAEPHEADAEEETDGR